MSTVATILPLAFGALRRNRMRSLLTSLGVIIGVGALIVTVASGEGSQAVLEEQLATLGTNLLIVLPGSSTLGGARGGPGTGKPLTYADFLAIGKGANAARYAAPVDRTVTQVVLDNQNWLTTVYGSTPDFFAIREWSPARGRLFSSSESDSGAKVCVLGQTVAAQLSCLESGDPWRLPRSRPGAPATYPLHRDFAEAPHAERHHDRADGEESQHVGQKLHRPRVAQYDAAHDLHHVRRREHAPDPLEDER